MSTETAPLEELRRRLADIYDLGRAEALLGWDERTYMPAAGAEQRSDVSATLARMRHELFCDERVGELLAGERDRLGLPAPLDDEAGTAGGTAGQSGGADDESAEAIERDLIRLVSRDWEKARLVPAELQAELARQATVAEQAWIEAREHSDFAGFAPHLERNVALTREFAACYSDFPGITQPYDALLDEYEPGMRTEELRQVLGQLRKGLVPLVADLPADPLAGDGRPGAIRGCLYGNFPPAKQRKLVRGVLATLPLPSGSWRLDDTTHPFATSIGPRDIRLTTRYDSGYIGTALWGAMHEAGHGMYEAGVSPKLGRNSLSKPRSLGLHESQSRLWENWVGRGRPYLTSLLPQLQHSFPGEFGDVDLDTLYRAANSAARSLIRVEADELTYNLHIGIRFELELELFGGDLEVADLPEAWNQRYRDYLGVDVPDDAHGVLQDVHWAGSAFGYFPTYSLGNIIAGQLWEAAERDIDGLEDGIAAGELAPLGEWLRTHVHRWGRRRTPAEVLSGAGCGALSVEPLLEHLRARALISGGG